MSYVQGNRLSTAALTDHVFKRLHRAETSDGSLDVRAVGSKHGELLRAADADNDSKVTREELGDYFEAADSSGDGKLQINEQAAFDFDFGGGMLESLGVTDARWPTTNGSRTSSGGMSAAIAAIREILNGGATTPSHPKLGGIGPR